MATVYLCGPENFFVVHSRAGAIAEGFDEVHQRVMHFTVTVGGRHRAVFFAVGRVAAHHDRPGTSGLLRTEIQEMVDLVHSYGCFFILHYHGNIKQVLRIRRSG